MIKTVSTLLQAATVAGFVFGTGLAFAQVTTTTMPASPALPSAVAPKPIPLWPDGAPGALGTAEEDQPTLTVYLPASNPTATGIIVCPGGGYAHLSMVKEGADVAQWLNERGVAAFVLKYRLGPRYRHPIELGDVQRAIRMVRAQAKDYGFSPHQLGVWGFSAGGHLASSAGTHFDAGNAASADAIEQQSSRPDFLVLAYPVITMNDPYVHRGSRTMLLGDTPDPALQQLMSNELQVTADTPPTFLFATTDDKTVPVMNSVLFYSALVKAGVPAEMHLFQHGAHGAGLAQANEQLRTWPDLLLHWLQLHGWAANQVAR